MPINYDAYKIAIACIAIQILKTKLIKIIYKIFGR